MFESFKEIVILGKGLIRSILRHVESAIFHFLPPKRDRLLPVIGWTSIDHVLQFLIGRNLPPILEPIRSPQILINIFQLNIPSILIIHDKLSNNVFIQGFGNEGLSIGRCEYAFSWLLLVALLLLLDLLGYLLEILE